MVMSQKIFFSEDIKYLINKRYESKMKSFFGKMIINKITINLNVFKGNIDQLYITLTRKERIVYNVMVEAPLDSKHKQKPL